MQITLSGQRDCRVRCEGRNCQCISRRSLCLLLGSISPLPVVNDALAASTPYQDAASIQYGLRNGAIRPCLGGTNPNCVSTASINDLYGAVWSSSERTVAAAAKDLETAVLAVCPDGELVASKTVANGQYISFEIPSFFGQDILEFLIRDDSRLGQSIEESKDGPIVMYRSMAGSVKYIWPLQTAVSDFGTQRKRLDAIRKQLGWQLIGCELLECYE